MSLYLDSTPGSVSANSYVSLEEAGDYFDARLYSDAWIDATSGVQQQSLIMATRQLDESYSWNGSKTSTDQSLDWPRSGVYDCEGQLITSTIIPSDIKNATYEQALYLLSCDSTATLDILVQGVKKAKLDVLAVEADRTLVPNKISDNVVLCMSYGIKRGSNSGILYRGM